MFSDFSGKKVIVRGPNSGVHYGTYVAHADGECEISNVRRIWEWYGAFTIDNIAQTGLDPVKSRLSKAVSSKKILDAKEILLVTEEAQKIIESAPEQTP
jgi:hypothetical protein